MAYRHADHAGNFADVLKHAVVGFCAQYMTRKDKPFVYLDTHAGAGTYDLASDPSAPWRDGIGRLAGSALDEKAAVFLAPYLDAVAAANGGVSAGAAELARYPGSPAIVAGLARSGDRLALVECAQDAAAALGDLKSEGRIDVEVGDGYRALKALLPPPERRGIVLIDPGHDDPDEMAAMAASAKDALERWPSGCFIFWRPLKDLWAAERFDVGLAEWLIADRGLTPDKILRADLWVRALETEGPLAGAGVVVVNPPWGLEEGLLAALPALVELFAQGEGAGWRLDGALTENSLTVDEF